jgi:hemolysin activation/secretion protein
LALTGGATKLFGRFPYAEAASVGGLGTLRSLDAQRYLGDASAYGSVELRIPVATFPLILPLNVGIFGAVDAGRVSVAGASPGGWHTSRGVGFWIGILDSRVIRLCRRPGDTGSC